MQLTPIFKIKLIIFFFLSSAGIESNSLHIADKKAFFGRPEDQFCWQAKFFKSFVSVYEINSSGRYAHEYHPYLLKETSQSMRSLEEALVDSGFDLDGRIALMGYEENSFARLLPRLFDSEGQTIDDEVSFFDERRGWSIELHNKFGTLSGFLFRQVPEAKVGFSSKFQHVNPGCVEIFGLGLGLLQRYHFGKLSDSIFEFEKNILQAVEMGDWRLALKNLISFWRYIYSGDIKTEDLATTGTQDILFSIANAEFIKDSPVDLKKFYVGPDITYPITISILCRSKATENAQRFLKIFTEDLQPVDGKNTVYIFRSFVDGVGKSTLLGNLKNYLKNGFDIEKFNPVDNTSTTEFELFEFLRSSKDDKDTERPKVFIADMPAQISHFTYKPDGFVYVDLEAIDSHPEVFIPIINEFKIGCDKYFSLFQACKAEVKSLVQRVGYDDPIFFDTQNPEKSYARNIILLGESDSTWIPFKFKGENFLGDYSNPNKVKKLLPIGEARSEGLKNAIASQMIFSTGIKFPENYHKFLAGLVDQFKQNAIKKVVFVDFLSMYSRSSRENIRLNYLLQQICSFSNSAFFKKTLDLDDSRAIGSSEKDARLKFSIKNSLYRQFTSECEILTMLLDKKKFLQARNLFLAEALTRLALYGQIQKLAGIFSVQSINQVVSAELENLDVDFKTSAIGFIENKFSKELKNLWNLHSKTKEFLNVYSLDFESIHKFSEFVVDLFKTKVRCRETEDLWSNTEGPLRQSSLPKISNKFFSWTSGQDNRPTVFLENGQKMRVCGVFSFNNKDFSLIDKVCRTIRSAWGYSLSNLFFAKHFDVNTKIFELSFESVLQIPVVLKKDAMGKYWLLEKQFEESFYKSYKNQNISLENPEDDEFINLELPSLSLEEKEKRSYPLNYTLPSTAYGFFGLGDELNECKNLSHIYFTAWEIADFYKYFPKNQAISAEALWSKIAKKVFDENSYWVRTCKKPAKKTGVRKEDNTDAIEEISKKNLNRFIGHLVQFGIKDEVFSSDQAGDDHLDNSPKTQTKVLQLPLQEKAFDEIARILATMQILIRDPNSTISPINMTRREFAANCGMFKFVSIPHYTGLLPFTDKNTESKLEDVALWEPVIPIVFKA